MILKFLRNNWLLILLALTATFLGLGKLYLSVKEPAKQVYENTWNGITPGVSSLNDLNRFGEPVSTEQRDGSTVFRYKSDVEALKHEVYSQGDKVGLVKEQVWGKENLEDYKTRYGLPEGEYFGDYSESNYKFYAYPSKGLAVIAHIEDGFVLEKWYFPPMALQEFLTSWGKDLTTEPAERF